MSRNGIEIRIGLSSCGIASGGEAVREALLDAVRQAGLDEDVVKTVGCNGMCHREPLIEIGGGDDDGLLYGNVTPQMARGIVRRHLHPDGLFTRARWATKRLIDTFGKNGTSTQSSALDRKQEEVAAYLDKQQRIVLENCGSIDPLRIEDYLAHNGYQALARILGRQQEWTDLAGSNGLADSPGMTPQNVVDAITASGLRGRGGAGFPTGRKWSFALGQSATTKYVICNGDEGDPGAFMDRLVLEADPHRVLEGLAIAAYAIGAREGFLYIRAEYPLAVRHINDAIRQAEQHGLLGKNILGSDFDIHLEIREGAGAFVCGEETAMIASLEGKRGTPRLRPPFPVEKGLNGNPTCINNVETLAAVPWIIRNGADAFASLGTESSKGSKVFALAGKIRRGGLIEVPMGITIREIVEDIGGGISNEPPEVSPEAPPVASANVSPKQKAPTKPGSIRTFKAIQIGGPSGGCLPASLADTPIDYEALAKTGAIMGSGGLVVLDDRDCMVDMARFFLQFTQAESCGKCTFCRVGTKRMLEILERLCEGKGEPDDLDKLEELADRICRASLCGLGQTAPNPVATTLKYFRDEYEAHLNEKRCPAGRCPALIHYRINDNCIGCTLCAQACPVDAIEFKPHEKHEIKDELCTRCDMCWKVCTDDAVEIG